MASVPTKSIDSVKESMLRCRSNPEFIGKFHDEFLNYPKVKEKFKDTNVKMQKVILKSTLHLMLNSVLGTRGVGRC